MTFLLGKKAHMTQVWKGTTVVPVTVIHAAPNTVSLIRTRSKDTYEAVQLALGKTKREFRVSGLSELGLKKGDRVTVESFQEGDRVRVSGMSKGRGFQGVVKRYNFGGGPKTHGQKNRLRAPGSLGATAPQRVAPGRRMAGHMGVERVTTKNITVVSVDAQHNTIFLSGAVPGSRGSLVEIQTMK